MKATQTYDHTRDSWAVYVVGDAHDIEVNSGFLTRADALDWMLKHYPANGYIMRRCGS